MNNGVENKGNTNTAIGLWARDFDKGPFYAVILKKGSNGYEVVWKKSSGSNEMSWRSFVNQFVTESSFENTNVSKPAVAVGFDSSSTAFYSLEVPPIRDEQAQAVVRTQAEALLPLPIEKFRLAVRLGDIVDNKRHCTVAAVNRAGVENFASSIKDLDVSKVVLDSEAVVKAWKTLYGGSDERSVIVRIYRADCAVLLAENGRLVRALRLDFGVGDLFGDDGTLSDTELFIHDLKGALEAFGYAAAGEAKVVLLSDNGQVYRSLVRRMRLEGIDTADVKLSTDGGISSSEDFEYLEAMGVSVLALDGDDVLGLFDDLRADAKASTSSKLQGRLGMFGLAAVLALVLFLAVAYATDKAVLGKFDDYRLQNAIKQYDLRKAVADQRPDILKVLSILNSNAPEGAQFDNLKFSKGEAITIVCHVRSWQQLYEFQKKLNGSEDISDVEIHNPVFDEKARQVNFRMTFNYSDFTTGG